MQVLVAAPHFSIRTSHGCIDGELVWFPDPCPDSKRDPDGPCSCAQTFTGLDSDGYTTTAVVREVPELTPDLFRLRFWLAHGLRPKCTCTLRPEMVDELISLAKAFPVGTVVRRRLRRLIRFSSPASG